MDKLIQKLLRESLNEVASQGLSPDEQLILDDLVSMNEAIDFNSLIQKLQKYAKTGALTLGIVMSLMSNDALAQEQKQQVVKVAEKTLSAEDVQTIQAQLKGGTGLDFDDNFVKDRFTKDDNSKPALPQGEELKALLIKGGVPGKYLNNVYIDYIKDSRGNETSGVKISVRLQEEGNFKRLANTDNQNKIMQRVIKALKGRPFQDAQGNQLSVSLEVKTPEGGMIGNREVKI